MPEDLAAAGPGDPVSALANRFRRVLVEGGASLEPAQRALFTGFVIGDDRETAGETRADFRASGLTHLLAVSGANVAFVLAVAAPALRRLGLRSRLVATLGLLAFFALLTLFRAVGPAGDRHGDDRRRHDDVGVAGLAVRLLAPLTVHCAGARRPAPRRLVGLPAVRHRGPSASSCVARPIAERLPGPRPLADGVAVAIAAQVAGGAVAGPTFGGVPLVAIPAVRARPRRLPDRSWCGASRPGPWPVSSAARWRRSSTCPPGC